MAKSINVFNMLDPHFYPHIYQSSFQIYCASYSRKLYRLGWLRIQYPIHIHVCTSKVQPAYSCRNIHIWNECRDLKLEYFKPKRGVLIVLERVKTTLNRLESTQPTSAKPAQIPKHFDLRMNFKENGLNCKLIECEVKTDEAKEGARYWGLGAALPT